MLNAQEQTMKTMRMALQTQSTSAETQQRTSTTTTKGIQNANANSKIIHSKYVRRDAPNNIDTTYRERVEKEEASSSDCSSSSEMPIGRLADRIEFIKRKCVMAMGLDGFRAAYNLMQKLQYEEQEEVGVDEIETKIRMLCH